MSDDKDDKDIKPDNRDYEKDPTGEGFPIWRECK
jgi:hypothetical protein